MKANPGVYLWAALLLLILPLNWVFSGLAAALIHEICHLLVLKLMGGSVKSVRITACGCVMETSELTDVQALFSILAGPAGSLLLALLIRKKPRLAVCGLFHGMYNLLPFFPLDGGRVLQLVLCRYCPEHADSIGLWTGRIFCLGILVATVSVSIAYHLGVAPSVLALLWVQRFLPRKIPCKP